jgi:hypothetical protein
MDEADSDSPASAGSVEAPRESADDGGAFGDTPDGGDSGENQPEAGAPNPASGDLSSSLLLELGAPLRFTSDGVEHQVEVSLGSATRARREAAATDLDALDDYSAKTLWTCPDGDYGEGAKLPAYLDEQEAVLVLRRPAAGTQRVDLLECGTAATLVSVELPAR